MKQTDRFIKIAITFYPLKMVAVLVGLFLSLHSALAAVYLDSATSISSAGNIQRAYRVPATNAAGVVTYYDINLAFTQDATGKPILAAGYPVIAPSPILSTGQFIKGNYKDGHGNIYTVGGPGIASGGRTT